MKPANPKPFNLLLFSYMTFFVFMGSSCLDTKKAVYFNNIGDTTLRTTVPDLESVIQKSDLLSIAVTSLNPEASLVFNMPATPGVNLASSGYLVDQDGFILFPILGNIKAAGLTKKQLSQVILKSLVDKKLLIDPIVNTRFLNYRVTVLGEVARPTVIAVANEKISLLEAIGLAGDLTIFAKRDNILIIREESGKKIIKRIDLNSRQIFNSPYYYLNSNDIVYAEPNKARVASAGRSQQLVPIVLSGLSLVVIVVDRLIR